MENNKKYRFGIIGAAGRGKLFKAGIDSINGQIVAICDINEEALKSASDELGTSRTYIDYVKMLNENELDAVVVGTPMQFHAEHSIAALERNINVLCEVPAVVSMAEAKQLVAAAKNPRACS